MMLRKCTSLVKNNWYFDENFEVVTELQKEGFTANELRIHRLKKMEKERHNYEELENENGRKISLSF